MMNFGWLVLSIGGFFLHPIIGIIFLVIYLWSRLEYSCWSYEFYQSTMCEKKGIFTSSMEEIHYYRIKSISMSQNFWEKIIGVYSYTIQTADPNKPYFILHAIRVNDRSFRAELKNNVTNERIEKGVRNMDIFER